MHFSVTTATLAPGYKGAPASRLGDFNRETFGYDRKPSEVLPFDPELDGEAVVVMGSHRHDSTALTTWVGIDSLVQVAERWAQWHGGEWVAGKVLVHGEVDEAARGTWHSWCETIAVPIRRVDGTGLETVRGAA